MAKAKVYLSGSSKNFEGVIMLKTILAEHGSRFLILTEKKEEANIEVDISDIDFTSDILEEAKEIIGAAKKVTGYEKKRKRLIREERKKLLFTTRKNIN